jgi:hypothetical protein
MFIAALPTLFKGLVIRLVFWSPGISLTLLFIANQPRGCEITTKLILSPPAHRALYIWATLWTQVGWRKRSNQLQEDDLHPAEYRWTFVSYSGSQDLQSLTVGSSIRVNRFESLLTVRSMAGNLTSLCHC